jgi:predicted methyltransferase
MTAEKKMGKSIFALLATALILTAPETSIRASDSDRLDEILAAQSEQARARYKYRSPRETLEFLGIEPGMTVIESLPGGGWYTRILLPYLGADGHLLGVDYSLDLTSSFEDTTDEDIAKAKAWVETWPAEAESWRTDDSAEVSAYFHGSLPESMHGTADAVLFIRALHGMASSESEGGYMSEALRESFDALKPGGLVGIVQHHARDNMSDDWAQGENGYLKKGYVIDMMEAAGFELVADSDMHANSKDQPATEDFVWRLPPSLNTSEDDPELRAQMQAIGESNRMTLKFRKP